MSPRTLEGRRALVTGGTRGIGAGIAAELQARGAVVAVTGRSSSTEVPDGIAFIRANLDTLAGVKALAASLSNLLGGIDILVNNAGGAAAHPGGLRVLTDSDWVDSLNINLLAAIRLTTALLDQFPPDGPAAIVNLSSSSAHAPTPPMMHYGVAKAGIHAFTKAASLDLAARRIRVNTVVPGGVDSDGGNSVRQTMADALGVDVQALHARIPLGRIGQPADIAGAVAYLVSDEASWVTGAEFIVDGGANPHV